MILLSGILADEMIELMHARLTALTLPFVFLDQLRYPGAFQLSWRVAAGPTAGWLGTPSGRIALSEITGVYARYVDYRGRQYGESLNEREEELVRAEGQLSLMQLFDVLPGVVVNRPNASVSNDAKPYQQQVSQRFGFATPRTIVTTVPEEARAFYAACGKRVIYKSLSSVRSIVRRLTDADLPRLQQLPNCPTQFQEVVEGVDVWVHTVGDAVFATEIQSDASDYRYARAQGASATLRVIELPAETAAACIALSEALGLVVAGIDLRRTPDGRWVCFEVNPSPGFLFYELSTGQPISEAVARLLATPA
jgi:glutathione synthase/RimK-type ligase-like ATP-grasp enzyme